MARREEPPQPLRGDEAKVFETHDARLRHSITRAINTSPDNVDDACAFAWMQFVRRQPERATAFGWLWRVAWREALRLDQADRSLEPSHDRDAVASGHAGRVEALLDARQRLAGLKPRERSALFLHGAGFSYGEIAAHMGLSRGQLNGALARATQEIRSSPQMPAPEIPADTRRGQLLAELLREPPIFLRTDLGKPPSAFPQLMPRRLEWSRLALAIIDFRLERRITDPVRSLGPDLSQVADPARDALQRDIARYDKGRHVLRPRGLER